MVMFSELVNETARLLRAVRYRNILCYITVFTRLEGTASGDADFGEYTMRDALQVALAAEAVERVGDRTLAYAPLSPQLHGYSHARDGEGLDG